jgi:hypothetical protein
MIEQIHQIFFRRQAICFNRRQNSKNAEKLFFWGFVEKLNN